ncbi:MAG TPA: hypothetical protein VFX50_18010, partial [Gemmatimonadales bacterium]|nr:hypothetical protein [Gemmatimonadales bacterium]
MPERRAWLEFVRRVLALRRAAPAFRRERFFPFPDGPWATLTWHAPNGEPLAGSDWTDAARHTLVALLRVDDPGPALEAEPPRPGERIWLLGLNGGARAHAVVPPAVPGVHEWRLLLDTAAGTETPKTGAWRLAPHALLLLEATVGTPR